MLKLKLNQSLVGYQHVSMLKKSIRAHMNYPTFHRMATGTWNTRSLETLARFLFANGYTVEGLLGAMFTDIFDVEETNDTNEKPERKYAIGQRVKSCEGEGTVQGYFYENGTYRVIVLHDNDLHHGETVPEAKDWVLFHYTEDELEMVNEKEAK